MAPNGFIKGFQHNVRIPRGLWDACRCGEPIADGNAMHCEDCELDAREERRRDELEDT